MLNKITFLNMFFHVAVIASFICVPLTLFVIFCNNGKWKIAMPMIIAVIGVLIGIVTATTLYPIHNGGWGFGYLMLPLIIAIGAASGFSVCGLIAAFVMKGGYPKLTLFTLIISMLLPMSVFIDKNYMDAFIEEEWNIWEYAMTVGDKDKDYEYYKSHFSLPTRNHLMMHLNISGYYDREIPAHTLDIMDQMALPIHHVTPLPKYLFRRLYSKNRNDSYAMDVLLENPSVPDDIVEEVIERGMFSELLRLARNANLKPKYIR